MFDRLAHRATTTGRRTGLPCGGTGVKTPVFPTSWSALRAVRTASTSSSITVRTATRACPRRPVGTDSHSSSLLRTFAGLHRLSSHPLVRCSAVIVQPIARHCRRAGSDSRSYGAKGAATSLLPMRSNPIRGSAVERSSVPTKPEPSEDRESTMSPHRLVVRGIAARNGDRRGSGPVPNLPRRRHCGIGEKPELRVARLRPVLLMNLADAAHLLASAATVS